MDLLWRLLKQELGHLIARDFRHDSQHRSHHCNELRPAYRADRHSDWLDQYRARSGGVIFVDLRDREGITQIVFRSEESPEAAKLSHKLRDEDVLQVTGRRQAFRRHSQ